MKEFRNQLEIKNLKSALRTIDNSSRYDSFEPVVDLQGCIRYVESDPLFRKDLSVMQMMEILKGNLVVFLLFDWLEFELILKEKEISIAWSNKKIGRREYSKKRSERLLIAGERIVTLAKDDSKIILGDGHLIRLYYDNVRPLTLCRQFQLMLEKIKSL